MLLVPGIYASINPRVRLLDTGIFLSEMLISVSDRALQR